jgi:hypothetical protein
MKDRTISSEQFSMVKSAKAPHLLGKVGFGVILVSFAIAVVNAQLPEPSKVISALLQPLIFVGIGSLLYHIGQHLHALHQNVIRMAMMEDDARTKEMD